VRRHPQCEIYSVRLLFSAILIGGFGLLSVFSAGRAAAASLEVFHADSLAGPMQELKKANDGMEFVKFLLTAEGQSILKETGQPPVVPAIRKGDVPAELK
jgi:ABC-type molybdate transport system substrate-binding protein